MNLDNDLRRAFQRKPAPPELAGKVLARIVEGDITPGRLPPSPQRGFGAASEPARAGVVGWLAAAAALTLIAAGGARYYVYQQDVAEAERVQAEISIALQITGEKLALVQRKVQDSQR